MVAFVRSLVEAGSQFVFRHFFRLLLPAAAAAEWICLWHVAEALGASPPPAVHAAGVLGLCGLNAALARAARTRQRSGWQRAAIRAYAAFAFTAMFGAAYLIAAAVICNGIAWVSYGLAAVAAPTPDAPAHLVSARAYQWMASGGLVAIALGFLHGYAIGQRRLEVTSVRVPLSRGAGELAGLRIVHISDIHLGQYMTPRTLAEYVERVNALDPDIVVLTGDVVDALDAIPDGLAVLATLRPRYGTYAVLGNHDFYAGADAVEAGLQRWAAFTVLRNASATLRVRGATLHLVGVDDEGRDWCRGVREHQGLATLAPCLPEDGPIVLLSHRPDLFPQAAALGIDLVLSGHTHGGQLALPCFGRRRLTLARLVTPFDCGLYRMGRSFLYVNRGLGCTGQRIRLFAPREIALIEIAHSGAAGD